MGLNFYSTKFQADSKCTFVSPAKTLIACRPLVKVLTETKYKFPTRGLWNFCRAHTGEFFRRDHIGMKKTELELISKLGRRSVNEALWI